MTLDQLEMLEAVIQEGSYQAAAKKINKSQPSLSMGIKKIEEYYSIQLFSRAGYRPVLTDIGRRFYESAKSTLSSYRQLHKLATELGTGIEPEINISIDPIVMANRFSSLLNILKKHEYKTALSITSGVLFDNAHSLMSGEVDLAIGHYPQIDNSQLESHKICNLELIPVAHKSLISKSKVDKSLFQRLPNIIVKTKQESDDNTSSTPGLKWYVDSHARKTELILLGFGWGRLSRLQFEKQKDIVEVPREIVEPISFDIHIMKHSERPLGPTSREIWNEMTENSH